MPCGFLSTSSLLLGYHDTLTKTIIFIFCWNLLIRRPSCYYRVVFCYKVFCFLQSRLLRTKFSSFYRVVFFLQNILYFLQSFLLPTKFFFFLQSCLLSTELSSSYKVFAFYRVDFFLQSFFLFTKLSSSYKVFFLQSCLLSTKFFFFYRVVFLQSCLLPTKLFCFLQGFLLSCEKGPLTGHKVTGLKFRLEDGQNHPVDSSEYAFQLAAEGAMQDVSSIYIYHIIISWLFVQPI